MIVLGNNPRRGFHRGEFGRDFFAVKSTSAWSGSATWSLARRNSQSFMWEGAGLEQNRVWLRS